MNKLARIAVTAGIALLAVAGFFAALRSTRTPPPPPPVVPAGQIADADLARAVDLQVRAIAADPDDAVARAELAMLYHVHELAGPAEAAYTQALALKDAPRWRWYRAELFEKRGAVDDAIAEIRKVVLAEPRFETGHRALARLLGARNADEALTIARGCTDRTPSEPAPWAVLAAVLANRGAWQESAEAAERAARLAPPGTTISRRAHLTLGAALRELGRADEAAVAFARGGTITIDEWPDPWRADLGRFLIGYEQLLVEAHGAVLLGRYADAVPVLQLLAARRPPGAYDVLVDLILALRMTGRIDEAGPLCDTAIRVAPARHEAKVHKALIAEEQGRRDEALAMLDELLATSPASFAPWEARGMMRLRADRRDDALADFRTALERDPRSSRLHLHVGYVLAKRGELDDAQARFEEARKLDPSSADAWAGLALVKLFRGDRLGCDADLRRSTDLSPEGCVLRTGVLWEIEQRAPKQPPSAPK